MILLISLPVGPGSTLVIVVVASLAVVAVVLVATSSLPPPILPLATVPVDPVDSPVRALRPVLLSPVLAGGIASLAIRPVLIAVPGSVLCMNVLLVVLSGAWLVLYSFARPV